jgi:glyoxylase I family protein
LPGPVFRNGPSDSARQNAGVGVSFMFAGLAVDDYAAAHDWYVRLLGREADMFPHDTESVWRLTPTSSIYVVEDRELAGNGRVTLALDDLDAHERRMREGGFTFTEEACGSAPRRLVVRDPDGNMLTFFQDPGRPSA